MIIESKPTPRSWLRLLAPLFSLRLDDLLIVWQLASAGAPDRATACRRLLAVVAATSSDGGAQKIRESGTPGPLQPSILLSLGAEKCDERVGGRS